MKMKDVCEATGLTDRAVRYYIQEQLIAPSFSENYLGRRTFDFSEADICELNDIAVLRKFGFSIAEIKEMIQSPESIIQISKKLLVRKQASINEEQALANALSRLDTSSKYTVSELAAFLSEPVCELLLPAENSKRNPFCLIFSFAKKAIIFFITWLPVVLAVQAIFCYFRNFKYPVFNGGTAIILTAMLLPTILILLASSFMRKLRTKRIVISVLLILCVLLTPINYFFTTSAFSVSKTSNHHNYRRFDTNSLVDRDSFVQDMLPAWPEYSDIKYYYEYLESVFGNQCEIYAEWSLRADDFAAEVSRVDALYDKEAAADHTKHLAIQIGEYTCFVLYSGSPPFGTATEDYVYYIFAYDENNLRVRYIHSYSEVGGQPYYLSLEW